MHPLVTVLIPAYNAERTIRRALASVFIQDYPALEVIVVDDGSMDTTSDVVAGYKRSEIQLLQLPKNLGECGAMNEGIRVAKGKYVAFLDADDEWLPGKLNKQLAVLEQNPKAIMATCGCWFVDAAGNIDEEFGMPPPGFAKDQIWRSLLVATCIAKPCVVARASAFEQMGLFDTTLRVAGDQEMWIRLAVAGEVEFIEEFLTVAHDTPGSLTKVFGKNEYQYGLSVIRRHIAAQRARLPAEEIRHILRERYTALGRNQYGAGRAWSGGRLILRAIALGGHPRENLWYLFTASPPARLVKALRPAGSPPAHPRPAVARRLVPSNPLLTPSEENLVEIPPGPPILIVGVDLEAEFDWNGARPRPAETVKNVREQVLVHRIFDKFGVRPIYLVDYAVASQPDGYLPLRELADSHQCEIGAHVQSWENPPFAEELGDRTSFNHNLPAWLQKEKLHRMTEALCANIGVQPLTYRAGRYGVGEEIAWMLRSLRLSDRYERAAGHRHAATARPGLPVGVQSSLLVWRRARPARNSAYRGVLRRIVVTRAAARICPGAV